MTRLQSPMRAVLLATTMLSLPLALSPIVVTPAYALFGFGDIVFDPSNYAGFLRYSFRASLRANFALKNLGFRCVRSAR